MVEIKHDLASLGLLAGIVTAEDVKIEPSSPRLQGMLRELIDLAKSQELVGEARKQAVRDLLRRGGFKPAGRNKPASEYLLQAAREDRFPMINNLVDINNYISLRSGLPASLLDLAVLTDKVLLRLGVLGEKYVFNQSGQEIDLTGLVCICRDEGTNSVPLGNAVKDSLLAKIKAGTSQVVGVVYAPQAAISGAELSELLGLFAKLLAEEAGGKRVQQVLV